MSDLSACTMVLLALALAGTARAQQPPPRLVQVSEVVRAEITPTVAVPGTIFSRNELQVTAGVAGRLVSVAEPGTVVQQGEPVARVDKATLLLQRAEQEALLERARIGLRRLDNDLKRQMELAGSKLVSDFDIEQTRANRDLAASDADIIGVRIRQIDEQLRLADTLAPFTGIVTERLRRGGEDVSRGEVLARMTDLENMEVRAFVPLKHLPGTRIGSRIAIFESDRRLDGTIRALIPAGDVRSQTFEARIDLPDEARGTWAVGQLVSVAIPVGGGEPRLTVPRDALVLRQNGQYVYRIGEDDTAERIDIVVGDSDGELIAVSGALREGDRVAIRGAESLTDGAAVRIVERETAAVDTTSDAG